MVNLVLVSHSSSLAIGVAELARAMTQHSRLKIALAAGTGDEEHPLGTNANLIHEAITSVYTDDGVIVLMDLGSAIMSAEMAIEFLPENQRRHVRLCAAPMIEGAIAAAVQASLGGALGEVAAEALGALASKVEQLGHFQPSMPPTESSPVEIGAREATLKIENKLGLHARPAALFVQTAARFKSDITIARIDDLTRRANAKSINAVASLGARQNEVLRVVAGGSDAEAALTALKSLVESKFGEEDEETRPLPEVAPIKAATKGQLIGIAASSGYAIGPAAPIRFAEIQIDRRASDDPAAEWSRLQKALDAVRESTQKLRDNVARSTNAYQAAIFDAHLMFLDDPELIARARTALFDERVNVEWAWRAAIDKSVAAFESIDDAYLRARAADVSDIGRQVLARLMGQASQARLPHPGVLIAIDLAPSDTARLDRSKVLGICTERGGPTSHSAILARTLGIPAVVGLGPSIMTVADGTPLAIDGQTGEVWIAPSDQVMAQVAARQKEWHQIQESVRATSAALALTQDGEAIEVVANIGSTEDARVAIDNGAEGVGLLRTEFLFLDRHDAPSEEEQYAAYCTIAEVMAKRPVIVRTLDVGGDKPLTYLELGHEENPFLGQRAIRLCLNRPDLFKTQLRAILRASPGHNLKIMFPMIADVSEVRRARALLSEARAELKARHVSVARSIEVGIMVEIPSAALVADALAPIIDFFSIGTNDLTQYTMAAERGNCSVAHLQDALHPAVLRQIQQTVKAAEAAGKWVGVCGELGGDPLAVPILIGLGVRELSMASASIPTVKQIIRSIKLSEAKLLARRALKLESAEAVRRLAQKCML